MSPSIYVFDPTAKDSQSKVRGIGRYLQLLKENFKKEFIFTDDLSSMIYDPSSVFINPFYNLISPPLLMKRVCKKQIAVIHDLIPLKYPEHFPIGLKGKLNVFLNKLSLHNYDTIVAVSEETKKDIIRILKVAKKKVKVMYSCLPKIFTEYSVIANENEAIPNEIAASLNAPRNDISNNFCLYVGDATWNKNLVNLAKAIKLADVTCVFVGKVFTQQNLSQQFNHTWEKELRMFAEITHDDKRFIFPGYVSDKELIALYEKATCNLFVSQDEGFGFSYLEASSQKTPSILSDIPVFHEIAKDTVLYVNPHNPLNIANTIKEIYGNEKLRNELGKKAYERSMAFSPSFFKKQFLSIFSRYTP